VPFRGEVLKVKGNALELLYWDKNQPMVYKREWFTKNAVDGVNEKVTICVSEDRDNLAFGGGGLVVSSNYPRLVRDGIQRGRKDRVAVAVGQ
jgi:hypothetical protein